MPSAALTKSGVQHDGFTRYYEAMKAVDPKVQVYSCFGFPSFVDLMGTDHPYDGLVMHPYAHLKGKLVPWITMTRSCSRLRKTLCIRHEAPGLHAQPRGGAAISGDVGGRHGIRSPQKTKTLPPRIIYSRWITRSMSRKC